MKIYMRWILLEMVAMMFIIQTIENKGIEVDPSEFSTEPSTEDPTEASTEKTTSSPSLSSEEAKAEARASFRRKEKKKYRDAAYSFHKCLGMDFKDCKRKLYRCVIDKSRSECMKEVDCFMNEVKICTKDLQDFKDENSKSSELVAGNKMSDDDSEDPEVSVNPSAEQDNLASSGENESKIHKKSKKIQKNEESEEASEESEEPSDEATGEQMNEVNSKTTTASDASSTIWDGFWDQ